MRIHAASLRPSGKSSRGFTLIEMVLVVLVILILLTLTVVVVGKTMDGDRVRGASRQVQNYLAGARDRAIYAASRQEDNTNVLPPAVGVRFLADPAFRLDDPTLPGGNRWRAFGSLVFVQENPPLANQLRVEDTGVRWEVSQLSVDPDGAGPQQAEPLEDMANRSVRALIDRGLVDSQVEAVNPITGVDTLPTGTRVYRLPITFLSDQAKEPYFVKFVDAPVAAGGSMGGPGGAWLEIGVLSKPYVVSAGTRCSFRLLPSPMPSEEPRILPRNTVVDVESSFVSGIVLWRLLRADGSFDVMFNSRGIVEGPLAAAGVINLVVADGQDVERGFRLLREVPSPSGFPVLVPAGPYVDVEAPAGSWDDADGDGQPDERRGELFIISIRTQTGSVAVSDLNSVTAANADLVVDDPADYYTDPFYYAELGGEAK